MRISCHRDGAQSVQHILQDQRTDGNDGHLERHGKCQPEMDSGIVPLQVKIIPAKPQLRYFFLYIPQAEQTGQQLGKDGGPAGARHAHVEGQNKYKIQDDIDTAGRDQKVQRHFAVPQGPQYAGEKIKQHRGGNTDEDNPQIRFRVVQNFRRCLQHFQHWPGKNNGNHGQHQGDGEAQQNSGSKTFFDAFFIIGPETLGSYNGKAGGESGYKSQNQEVNASCPSHRCQCVDPDGAAHDQGVRHAVELLKNISDQQRECKNQNQFCRISGGHISCHNIPLSFL